MQKSIIKAEPFFYRFGNLIIKQKTARLMALAIFQTAVDLCSGYARLPTCIPVINGMNKLYLLSMKFSIFAWRFTCVLFKHKREMALGSKAEKGTYSK